MRWNETPDPLEIFCGQYQTGRRPSWLRHPIIRHRMNKNLRRAVQGGKLYPPKGM